MNTEQIKEIESILESEEVEIQGVKIKLKEEQLQKSQQLIKSEYKHPFERVNEGEYYYSVVMTGGRFRPFMSIEKFTNLDNERFEHGNYYNNKELVEQVTMDMNLQQKLRKFVYENSGGKELWKCKDAGKYYIALDADFNKWIWRMEWFERNPFQVYFKDLETVERAIEEVVRPFCKKHSNYRFQEDKKEKNL